ncbi:hypothetical protein FCV25MIE_00013 [Fagus crenata]
MIRSWELRRQIHPYQSQVHHETRFRHDHRGATRLLKRIDHWSERDRNFHRRHPRIKINPISSPSFSPKSMLKSISPSSKSSKSKSTEDSLSRAKVSSLSQPPTFGFEDEPTSSPWILEGPSRL